jgi:tetratricopeptide (TPR) repeat protein
MDVTRAAPGAIERAERAVRSCREAGMSTWMAVALGNLAAIHEQLGHTAKAQNAFDQALALAERLFGPDHPDVAMIHSNLGVHYMFELDEPNARLHLERARDIFTKNHIDTYGMLAAFVSVAELTGDGDGMVESARRARDVAIAKYGPGTMMVSQMTAAEAAGLAARGDYDQAVATARKAVAELERLGDRPVLAYAQAVLGDVLCQAGQATEGRIVLERAVATEAGLAEEDSRPLAEILELHGRAELDVARPAEAERTFQRAIELLDLPGDPRPRMIPALIGLGQARLALARPADAIAPLERATELAR